MPPQATSRLARILVRPEQFQVLLREIARVAVASALGTALACGARGTGQDVPGAGVGGDQGGAGRSGTGGGGSGGSGQDGFQAVRCDSQGRLLFLEDLELERSVDFLGVYRWLRGIDTGQPLVHSVAALGRSCQGASNTLFCDQELVRLRDRDLACPTNDCAAFLLTTTGDEVERLEELAAIRALLGSIDTEGEAVLVAVLAGLEARCPDSASLSRELSGTQVRATASGYEVRTEWEECGVGVWRDTIEVSPEATTSDMQRESLGTTGCTPGRIPAGLRAARPAHDGTALGRHLASAARLEAASVFAFERLARELRALSAPPELVTACLESALDEVRHARGVGALAARHGATPAPVELSPIAPRTAFEIALENAVEGCVRETFGAVVAHCQAMTARDPDVRAVMTEIALDESRHARLSWQVATWLEPQLCEQERAAVSTARRAALLALYGELEHELPPQEQQLLGLPPPAVARVMLDGLAATLLRDQRA